jgi:serine/threonine-protein kinase
VSDELIGVTLLDSYKVERVLGEGGMGRIYLANHTRIAEKRFAVKVLRPELVSSPHIRARFDREVEAVARVNHPGVLTIVDVGTTNLGWPFMVCEYLSGLDLLAYLKSFGRLPDERVVHLGTRVAEALEATHARGVIHRDIKPSNVFLMGTAAPLVPEWDRVKLIDFGLSRFVGRDDQLTKAGIVMGTPAYMSPEQAGGGRVDHLTDVYGVGAVLYAAATGVPPFREKTQQETILALMSRDPVRPREVNASISEALELVIQRAMAKRPEDRYPSMSALRLALSNMERALPSPHFGASAGAGESWIGGVRWRIAAVASSTFVLCLAALASVTAGFVALADLDLTLTTTEKVLLLALCASLLALLGVMVHRFWRRTWQNTAALSERLPRLRAPVLAALVVYAVASFAVRLGEEVFPRLAWEGTLMPLPRFAGWGAPLALLGLLAGLLVAIHQSWWQPMRPLRRWLWAAGLAAVVGLGAFGFMRGEYFVRSTEDLLNSATSKLAPPSSPEGGAGLRAGPGSDARTLPSAAAAAAADAGSAVSARDAAVPRREANSELLRSSPYAEAPVPPPAEPTAALETPSSSATPTETASLSVAAGTDRPSGVSSERARELEARALDYSERAQGMAQAVRTIEQLLAVSPASALDPDVRRILRRAASSEADVSREALRVMSEAMGAHGPDLLYELMLQRPALAERAKHLLSRFRVRKLFSPELAIAYDLRFAPSCASRVWLLPRANDVGDQRAVNTLSELIGKHQRCDGKSAACLGPCQREAVQFSRSIDMIVKRLHAGGRAAAAN